MSKSSGATTQVLIQTNAADGLTWDQTRAVLSAGRRNNPKNGVTGMLIHRDGVFLSLIEGSDQAVQETLDRISLDPRQVGLKVLARTASNERICKRWVAEFLNPAQDQKKVSTSVLQNVVAMGLRLNQSMSPATLKAILSVFGVGCSEYAGMLQDLDKFL